jgi:hypothetical protein
MASATATVSGSSVIGAQRQTWGTLAVVTTGGEFDTGLKYVNSCVVTSGDTQDAGGVLYALNSSTNGKVTITVTSGEFTVAQFVATGYGGG